MQANRKKHENQFQGQENAANFSQCKITAALISVMNFQIFNQQFNKICFHFRMKVHDNL